MGEKINIALVSTIVILLIVFLVLWIRSDGDISLVNKTESIIELTEILEITMEESYFEGQKDAIEGDIRIKMNADSVYIWTKSCWNSGKQPEFQPTYLDSQ